MLILIAVFFVTSVISVVTGSTSVITVPVLFQFGIDPRVAVATNMFALTFMSLGGTLPFLSTSSLNRSRLAVLIPLTLLGSAIGAFLLLAIPKTSIPSIVSTAILCVAVFATVYRRADVDSVALPRPAVEITAYVLTFLIGVYGGMFSGGYVTILTAIFVLTFRMSFIEAMATTKLMNIFSSGIATVIFMLRGAINYRLGLVLAITMFAGGLLGASYARRSGSMWVRRIFLAAVWLLGLKTLFDALSAGFPRKHETVR